MELIQFLIQQYLTLQARTCRRTITQPINQSLSFQKRIGLMQETTERGVLEEYSEYLKERKSGKGIRIVS